MKVFLQKKLILTVLFAGFNLVFLQSKTYESQSGFITLNLGSPTNPSRIVLNEKGYWNQTYNTSGDYRWLEFGVFKFSHILNAFGGNDVGGGMSYWDGFTYSTSGDNTNYGESGSSSAWVEEQWGCMPGGGIKTDGNGNVIKDESGKVLVEKGNPYLVAYWGYWIELMEGGAPCLQMKFADGKEYKPVGVYIANHPWPYCGNIHGDGFARAFDQEGDIFKLLIHGMNDAGEPTGTQVEHILAEFKNGVLIQSPDWNYVDLSSLGTVSGLYFTMETSDADPVYGPNTAVYFCLDKLQVMSPEATTAPSRPTGLRGIPTENTIDFSWTVSDSSAGVRGYNLYLNETFVAFEETTNYVFTGLQPYTQYQIQVEAIANDYTPSEKAGMSVQTTDVTPPSMPANLNGTTTQYTMTLSWDASTDNVAVTEYHIYLNDERQKRIYTTNYMLTGLDAGTEYLVEVEARDAAGNRSVKASVYLRTMGLPTDLPEASRRLAIKVYGKFIEIENAQDRILQIFNLKGQIQLSYLLPPEGKSVIDISGLPQGVYLLKTGSDTYKIIKQ